MRSICTATDSTVSPRYKLKARVLLPRHEGRVSTVAALLQRARYNRFALQFRNGALGVLHQLLADNICVGTAEVSISFGRNDGTDPAAHGASNGKCKAHSAGGIDFPYDQFRDSSGVVLGQRPTRESYENKSCQSFCGAGAMGEKLRYGGTNGDLSRSFARPSKPESAGRAICA